VRNLYRRAEGLRLAAQAELLAMERISSDPSVALILATESMKWQKSFEADRALRAALAVAAPIYWQLPKGRSPVTVTASLPSGKLIAVGYADGCCRVFDPDDGNGMITVRHEPASRPHAPMRSGGRPPGGSRTEALITMYTVSPSPPTANTWSAPVRMARAGCGTSRRVTKSTGMPAIRPWCRSR
jgi:hypothetical protein